MSQYDLIADKYDGLFQDDYSLSENAEVGEMLRPLSGSVLDIGCGTGLLTEIVEIKPFEYVGIDPSNGMLNKFKEKHPSYSYLVCSPYDGKVLDCSLFDNVISLFGSPSYLDRDALDTIAKSGKRVFLMFYKEDYHPVTYEKCGVEFSHNNYSIADLSSLFGEEYISTYDNYIIVDRK